MSTWAKQKLGDVVDFIDGDRGKQYPSQGEFYDSGFCLFLSAKNIPDTKFEFDEKMFITAEKDSQLRKGKLKRGDYVLTTRGTVGNFAYYSKSVPFDNVRLNSGMVILRKKSDKLNNKYLLYFLMSPLFSGQIKGRVSGSAQPQLPIRDMISMQVELPEIKTQQRIASVLSAYDELIENNEKRIKILEEMAQRFYIEWFIKLKFLGYEKARMIDSGAEFGKIPEGWSIGNFEDIVSVLMGLSPKGEFYNFDKKGLPLLNGAGDFAGENMIPERFTSQVTRIAKKGDIIFCIRGTIGNVTIADRDYCIGRGVAALSAKEQYYSYSLFILKSIIRRLNHISTGAVIRGISRDDIAKYKVLIPPENILIEFAQTVDSTVRQREDLRRINFILKKIRDHLIPQLVTGKRELS